MSEDKNNPKKKTTRDDIPSEEKGNRRFTLSLVFIVIIGLSLVVFILKMRQARERIILEGNKAQPTKPIGSQSQNKVEKKEESNQDSKKTPDSPRNPQGDNTASQLPRKKKLLPSPHIRQFDGPEKRTKQKPLFQLDSTGDEIRLASNVQSIGNEKYNEVENVFAIPEEKREEFDSEDILYERGPFIIVKVDGQAPAGAMAVAYNQRTRRLGVVTGQMILRFNDSEAFEKRSQNFQNGEVEIVGHPNTLTSILSVQNEPSLQNLKKRESFWSSLPGIKAAKVEILESEILLK